MNGLTLDELLPLQEYVDQRSNYFEAHQRYVDRYRRVKVGPSVTLIFENRQTLWYRLQEVIRISRTSDPKELQDLLDIFNPLLPRPGSIQATLLLDIDNESKLTEELSRWQSLRGEDLTLRVGDLVHTSNLYTSRPEDRCYGAAHWVQFNLEAESLEAFRDRNVSVVLRVSFPEYEHESPPVTDEVRHSLIEDLEWTAR